MGRISITPDSDGIHNTILLGRLVTDDPPSIAPRIVEYMREEVIGAGSSLRSLPLELLGTGLVGV